MRWLFLDELTNGLDIARDHSRAGGGAVAILHDLTLSSLFADRVVIVDNCRLGADGASADILSAETVRSVFGDRLKLICDLGGRYIVPVGPAL